MPKKRTAPKKHPAPAPAGYRDIFDVRSASKGPLILSDCTSVEWPKGWNQADADRWRQATKLEKPA